MCTDHEGDLLNLAMVHYSFDNEEHRILPHPHGNSKSQSAYVRTMPSTMCKLREVSRYLPPKHAIGEVSKSVGGLPGASSVSVLPRNRQQSADCRRNLFSSKMRGALPQAVDPLFPVMIMCKESEGANSDPKSRFVRIVCNTPEPMTVLTFDWTLVDLERFCTDPRNHVVLSVDPTFNLGSFHVTVTTYRHPMLEYRHQRRGSHPVMFGPMFIHQRKTFATYNFFFSQLVGLKPSLRDIQCFGTDGEKALEESLHTQFKCATHLRCFLHFRGNIESKLLDLGISKSNSQEFVRDILGNPALLEEGLVDADSDHLDEEFEALRDTWNARERSLTRCTNAQFHDWFQANSLEVVRECMLKEKRESAGLGSPPEPFYTNDVESKNKVLKHQTHYKAQQLPSFVQSMKSMYEDQKQEIDKAVVGLGEYQLCSSYRSLGVSTKEWFKKNEKQRTRILDRFGSAKLESYCPQAEDDVSQRAASPGQDSPSTSNPLRCTRLPSSTQYSMWAKVQSYLEDESSYTKSPGSRDYSSILVKSTSSERPHFVSKTKTSVYKCDKDCLMFKSTNGICSHSLLGATLNGEVDAFVSNYAKSKVPINYANLGQHGLPTGGKKPSSKRKASSKKSTSAVKTILAAADHIARTKRAKTTEPSTQQSEEPTPVCSPALVGENPSTSVYGIMANHSTISNMVHVSTSLPPPLLHLPPSPSPASVAHESSVGQPFQLVFLNARISRCQGCRGQIEQKLSSPWDIVLQHKEHVLFQNPRTGIWQMSRDLRNTYYHPRLQCIARKHPEFSSSEIKVSENVKDKLSSTHLKYLTTEFGRSFLD